MDRDRDLKRFMKYVEKTEGCWIWVGAKLPRGYGRFYFDGKPRYAHRVSVELATGNPVPPELLVIHSCDNPSCVNPGHLSVGTQTMNMRDAADKGRTVRVGDWTGTRNPKSKLTKLQLESLRERIVGGAGTTEMAREFGISRIRVQQIKRLIRAAAAGGGDS